MSEEIREFLKFLKRLPPYEGIKADIILIDEVDEIIKKSEGKKDE